MKKRLWIEVEGKFYELPLYCICQACAGLPSHWPKKIKAFYEKACDLATTPMDENKNKDNKQR